MHNYVYNVLLLVFFPVILLVFFFRVIQGKEEKKKYLARFGIANKRRPSNKQVIWFNACSVGEAKSILGLVKIFLTNGDTVLITSNTLLSSFYIRNNFPEKIIHQFTPFDFIFTVKRFIKYWKPKIGIFVESELWPNLIKSAKKNKIPLFLIQARFSEKTLNNWSYFDKFFKSILNSFDLIIAQSEAEKNKIKNSTGINVNAVINLKLSSIKLKTQKKELSNIKGQILKYTTITALSTHPGEEKILLESFKVLKKKCINLILILQPRHPARSKEVIKLVKNYNLVFKTRSLNQYPDKNTDVYIFDTFGESGNLISASDIIILGGTLTPIGGHNIIEPAQFGKCIISGEYYYKIKDTIALFKKSNAAFTTNNIKLADTLELFIKNKKLLNEVGNNAYKLTKTFENNEKLLYKKIKIFNLKNENSKILV